MSAPGYTEAPQPARARRGARSTVMKAVAAGAAVVALVLGANAITKSNASSAGATGSQSAQTAPAGAGAGAAGAPQLGSQVTGATLTKLKSVATAKYPSTVERAMKLPDGSYVVHVVQSDGEVHVLVSKAFEVTGVEQGGPPGGTPPAGSPARGTGSGNGSAPPAGSTAPSAGTSST